MGSDSPYASIHRTKDRKEQNERRGTGSEQGGGVRREDAQRPQRRGARADDLHRPPDRPLRRYGGAGPPDQRADRLGGQPDGALRPRVARRHGHRRDRRAQPRGRDLPPSPRARGLLDQGSHTRQHRRHGPVHPRAGLRRGPDRGELQERRRGALFGLHALPRGDGRRQRPDGGGSLTDYILPLVPGLTGLLETGIDVLDVGCGSGRALDLMARKFPESSFVGYDFSEEAIARARAAAQEHGTANVRFEVKDVSTLDEGARYDLITTFDAIHDQSEPAKVLEGIAAALRDDGVYLMQDIAGSSYLHNNLDHPLGPFMYTVSTMHCMTVSLAQGGAGLGTMWGEEKAKEMLRKAGFGEVAVERLPHDIANSYFVARKG